MINNVTGYLLWKTAARLVCLILWILSGNLKLSHRFPYMFIKLSCNHLILQQN